MRNEANLPTEKDADGKVSLIWRGVSIQDQFPWTRIHQHNRQRVSEVTLTTDTKEGKLTP
jgi:hypothetical protein